MLVIYEACFVQKAFCMYTLALGSRHPLSFSAINILHHRLSMPWDDTTIVDMAMHAWLICASLLLAKLCDYALLCLHAGK